MSKSLTLNNNIKTLNSNKSLGNIDVNAIQLGDGVDYYNKYNLKYCWGKELTLNTKCSGVLGPYDTPYVKIDRNYNSLYLKNCANSENHKSYEYDFDINKFTNYYVLKDYSENFIYDDNLKYSKFFIPEVKSSFSGD